MKLSNERCQESTSQRSRNQAAWTRYWRVDPVDNARMFVDFFHVSVHIFSREEQVLTLITTVHWLFFSDWLCCEMFKAFSSRSPRRISAACWALCDFPMWIFNPDSDLKWLSHWSHWKAALCLGFSLTVSLFSCCWAGWCFLFRNSSLRFAFLRRVDGLAFFLVAKVSLHLVSRVKEKVDPMLSENWKALPWLDSAWQKARHLVAREESVSSTLAILVYFWIKPKMELEERKGMSFCYWGNVPHSGEKSNKCSLCDFASIQKSDLRRHLKTHSGEKSNKCNLCDFASHQAGDLRKHMKKHSGEKSNQCNLCDFASSRVGNLRRHLKIHSGEKWNKWNQRDCDYKCTQAGNLKTHMLTHNGQKPFTCNQCSYTCTQAVSLEKHMLTHSGEKPFSCNECDYKCRDANNLKTHKFIHTGEKPFACKQCNYSCKSLLPKGLPF